MIHKCTYLENWNTSKTNFSSLIPLGDVGFTDCPFASIYGIFFLATWWGRSLRWFLNTLKWRNSFLLFGYLPKYLLIHFLKKQPSRDVIRKWCSENMQQTYRRTSMPKCDFNKVAKQLVWNHTSAWVFSCKFAAIFRTPFSKNISGRLLLFLPAIYSYIHYAAGHRVYRIVDLKN